MRTITVVVALALTAAGCARLKYKPAELTAGGESVEIVERSQPMPVACKSIGFVDARNVHGDTVYMRNKLRNDSAELGATHVHIDTFNRLYSDGTAFTCPPAGGAATAQPGVQAATATSDAPPATPTGPAPGMPTAVAPEPVDPGAPAASNALPQVDEPETVPHAVPPTATPPPGAPQVAPAAQPAGGAPTTTAPSAGAPDDVPAPPPAP